jgi:hypothetical protein
VPDSEQPSRNQAYSDPPIRSHDPRFRRWPRVLTWNLRSIVAVQIGMTVRVPLLAILLATAATTMCSSGTTDDGSGALVRQRSPHPHRARGLLLHS